MTANGYLQLALYLVVLLALAKPFGAYMARVYENQPIFLGHILGPVERILYRLAGVRPDVEMTWKSYALAMLTFNMLGLFAVYLLQRVQGSLPLNPESLGAVAPHLAFNTAASFASNTNWQSYGGETTLSYLTQMLGLTVQNFVSAASGMACLVAVIRGLVRRTAQTIGNFWVDLVRSTLYILVPLSLVGAILLVSQGVVQTFQSYVKVQVVQPTTYEEPATDDKGQPVLDEKGQPKMRQATLKEQVLAVGPAASQIIIKQLGTNGGGFFNVNSSHPFENPTPLSNFLIPFVNTTGGLAMLFSRFWLAVPMLAIAGSLARKKLVPPGAGTLPTHTPLFVVLLAGTVILVGALTFIPALALGPIVEHLQMLAMK